MGMQITGQSGTIAFEFTCDLCKEKVRDLARAYAAWQAAPPSEQMRVYHKGICLVPEGYQQYDLLNVMGEMQEKLAEEIKEYRP